MKKKLYAVVLVSLGAVVLVDLLWPDHHHVVFAWHAIAGFDTFFGFVGCLALMIGSLSLGEFFLWRTTYHVLLTEEEMGPEFEHGMVTQLGLSPRQKVKAGDILATIKSGDRELTVKAPMDGTVSEIFCDLGGFVRLGETVVNLRVPKNAMHHNDEETGDA